MLFVRGAIVPRDLLGVAIVGSRHATHYGLKIARQLASGLARPVLTIVSGLARGIDAAAHQGALDAGGRTLGVLGSGVLTIYPPEHVALSEQVIRSGALISEAPLRAAPTTGSFPQRNRLISGLTLGVIVVEAADRSGALITARHAMEQGREVFAVPGRIDERMSRGCHRLIRDGATLVETIDDVLAELGPLAHSTETATANRFAIRPSYRSTRSSKQCWRGSKRRHGYRRGRGAMRAPRGSSASDAVGARSEAIDPACEREFGDESVKRKS